MEPLAARDHERLVAQAIANALAAAEPIPRAIRFEGINAASIWPRLVAEAWPGRARPHLDTDRAATQPGSHTSESGRGTSTTGCTVRVVTSAARRVSAGGGQPAVALQSLSPQRNRSSTTVWRPCSVCTIGAGKGVGVPARSTTRLSDCFAMSRHRNADQSAIAFSLSVSTASSSRATCARRPADRSLQFKLALIRRGRRSVPATSWCWPPSRTRSRAAIDGLTSARALSPTSSASPMATNHSPGRHWFHPVGTRTACAFVFRPSTRVLMPDGCGAACRPARAASSGVWVDSGRHRVSHLVVR